MKKLLLVLCLVSFVLLLVACDKDKDNNSKASGGNGNNSSESQGVNTGVREVSNKDTNFDDELGFSIEKGKEVKDIKYDTIFLHGDDRVQLDLQFGGEDKIGTLTVSKFEEHSSDEVEKLLIAETDVSKVTGIDGIDCYSWEKDGFFYSFSTKRDSGVTKDDISKIIIGYNVKVAEEKIED